MRFRFRLHRLCQLAADASSSSWPMIFTVESRNQAISKQLKFLHERGQLTPESA